MEKFNEIASKIFGLSIERISDSLKPADVPNWDSMNYLLFISEIESEYDVSLSMSDVLDARCLGDVRKAVQNNLPGS
jgi:acyl carrier protein